MSSVLIIFSCSGEDGETGPPGKDGNANVIVSDWMPIVWTWADYQTADAFMDVPVEDMTSYLDNGDVVVMYIKNYSRVEALPSSFSSGYLSFDFGTFPASESFETNDFEGFRFYSEGNLSILNIFQNDSEKIDVRYVLVPANVVETTGLSMDSKLNLEETMELIGMDSNQY
ncbi:hypothetical protein [Flagellimonas oceanensis]|uniref:hypothetical protein n=1 Tax=Flagellimonas oceanensis TaxID=2499163 RepID=UPI003BAB5AAA